VANVKETVKFPGVEVQLQNMVLEIPTMNFRLMRREGALVKLQILVNEFDSMGEKVTDGHSQLMSDAALDAAVDLVWMAAHRNYPDLSKEQIEEGLDMDNIKDIIPILISRNPVKAVAEGKNSKPQAVK